VAAEAAARQHSGSLGDRSGSLVALAAAEAQWQQLGGGGSRAAAAAAAQQRSAAVALVEMVAAAVAWEQGGVGGGGSVAGIAAAVLLWKVRRWQYGGSVISRLVMCHTKVLTYRRMVLLARLTKVRR
jgi:hypothetical protein